jgi:serine/threonine protein kinase
MVFEYCENGSIESLMNDLKRPFTELEIQYIVKEILDALVYLHDTCLIIHRDIKAGNILLTEKGDIKVSDFGVAAKNTRY